MLNKSQIELIPERIYQRLNAINIEYLVSIGEVIKDIGELRPTDIHQLQQMYNFGAQTDKMAKQLAEATEKNIDDIYKLFDAVAKDNYTFAKPFYEAKLIDYIPYEQNIPLQQKVNAMAKQTVDEYVNLSQHTAFAVFAKDGKSIAPYFAANKDKIATSTSEIYTKISDYAITQVQLGMESYSKAVKDIIKTMSASGIRTMDYAKKEGEKGYSRRLDTAVRQNVLWAVKECNQQTANLIGEQFGSDGREVDYHMYPRPSHEAMGGRQFALGKARTVNGTYYHSFEEEAAPLLAEYGCLHFSFPIILGVSQPAYSERELEQYSKSDNATFEFEGKKYTMYEGTQLQRKTETALRHQRDILNMAKAAGDGDTELIARTNIRMLTDKYIELSEVSGLPTQMERTRLAVSGVKNEKGITKKRIHNTSENKVDLSMLSTKEYRNKFNSIPCCKEAQQTIYEQAKAILTHRNGTYFEDVCLIDVNTGKLIEKSYNNKSENEVIYSLKAQKAIKENKNSLIVIHNHGTNNPPTGSDFVSAGSKQYVGGIVACHNGDIYYYKPGNKAFRSEIFAKVVDNYMKKGYNEKEAIKETLDYYAKKFGIEWRLL